MRRNEGHKATATSSCFHSKSTLTEDSQSKNREQCVLSILTEKSQKVHCHWSTKQAYFVLQLCISMPFPSTQDLQKPWWKQQFPQRKRFKHCHPKTVHLQDQYIMFYEALWTWCSTKNLTYWHFSERAWECCLCSGRASFDEQSLTQCCQPTTLYDKCHYSVKPSLW